MPRNPDQWDVDRVYDAVEQEAAYDPSDRRDYLTKESKLALVLSTEVGFIILVSLVLFYLSLNQPEMVHGVVVDAEGIVNGMLSIF